MQSRSSDPDKLLGAVFASRYRVEERVGDGAMGIVYRARHVKVGRAFAVKVLHQRLIADPKIQKRFDREAELAGALHHINVIGVVDVGETEEGQRFLVMEYADGPTLSEIIAEAAPMASGRVIALAQQLCDGLQHAHERGLIHRDFKPENVIVERDRHGAETPRIVDFGVAILRDDAISAERERLTTAGLVLGTPHYMAPEHATGEPIDHRIDLFALGVILYEMISGRLPFDGDGVDVARANLTMETPPMGTRVPNLDVDPLLEAFTRRLMAKSRDARPPTARAARRLLDLIERDRDAAAEELGVVDSARPRSRTPRGTAIPARAQTVPTSSDGVPIPMPPAPTRPVAPPGSSLALAPPPPPVLVTDSLRAPTPLPFDDEEPRASRKIVWIAAAAVVAIVVVASVALLKGRGEERAVATIDAKVDVIAAGSDVPGPGSMVAPGSAIAPIAPGSDAAPGSAAIPSTNPPTSVGRDVTPQHTVPHAPPGPGPVTHPQVPPPPAHDAAPPHEVAVAPPLDAASKPPAEITPKLTVPSGPSTPAAAAQLYGKVGRELKALDVARGSAATADLWPLYLRIRINDVISDTVKRDEAMILLTRLHEQISARQQ